MFGAIIMSFVKEEVQSLIKDAIDGKNIKHELYLYIDAMLVEAKSKGCDQYQSFIDQKRAELKTKMGE